MIRIDKIIKHFPDFHLEIDELIVDTGSYVVILGDSGSGKSLLLEIMAGLINPDSGTIEFEDENLVNKKIQNRPFGLVFQDQALFPHMTVKQNIAFPLKNTIKNKELIEQRVLEIAKKMEAEHLLSRYPETLSGGDSFF